MFTQFRHIDYFDDPTVLHFSVTVQCEKQLKMSGILATISNAARATQLKAQQIVDAVVPPEKRSQAYERLQIFAAENPKLSVSSIGPFPASSDIN